MDPAVRTLASAFAKAPDETSKAQRYGGSIAVQFAEGGDEGGDFGGVQTVEDRLLVAAGRYEIELPELGEVLGKGGLAELDLGAELVDADLALAQTAEDSEPLGIGHGLKRAYCPHE